MKKRSYHFWHLFFLLNLFNMSVSLLCAGPLMHIYLAQQWLSMAKKYDAVQAALFIRGTLFPDIRYLAGIDKHKTHEKGVTIDAIFQEPHAFKAGMKFHTWVDNFRIQTAELKGLALVGKNPGAHFITFLKLIEDEIIYDTLDHEYLMTLLQTVPQEEYEVAAHLEISPEVVITWHHHLIQHVKTRPRGIIETQAKRQEGYLISITPEIVQLWNIFLPLYCTSDAFKNYVDEMIQCFITTFTMYLKTQNDL